jgi:hypothetical protein
MSETPINFRGITEAQLRDSLKNGTPIMVKTAYMGILELGIPVVVTEVGKSGPNITFEGKTNTPDGKEWKCHGYITPDGQEGVMIVPRYTMKTCQVFGNRCSICGTFFPEGDNVCGQGHLIGEGYSVQDR